jgi:hypothetical protein
MQTFSKLKTDEFSPFRRNFLQSLGCGFGSMALGGLWAKEAHGGDIAMHHLAKAKAVIQIFCPGGVSQVDTWDYKPELAKRNGTPTENSSSSPPSRAIAKVVSGSFVGTVPAGAG